MRRSKQLMCIILSLCISMIISTAAALTSSEKEEIYGATVLELESYLENPGENNIELVGIISSFEELGGYAQSLFLGYYANALYKIDCNEFDQLLILYLDMLDNDPFNQYLTDSLKGSSIRPVDELKAYAKAREYEMASQIDKALEMYKNCLSFYDSPQRYLDLQKKQYKDIYDEAKELINLGDYAGAYFKYKAISKYQDSALIMESIVTLLGYTPSSPSDNLLPVTNVKIVTTDKNQIKIEWKGSLHASSYEIYYKTDSSTEWIFYDEVSNNFITVLKLKENELYDFKIISKRGALKSAEVIISSKTAAPAPTPTPSPTAAPTPLPTQTPVPANTNVSMFFMRKICDLEPAFEEIVQNAEDWNRLTAPQKISDIPLMPGNWAEMLKELMQINISLKKDGDNYTIKITKPSEFSYAEYMTHMDQCSVGFWTKNGSSQGSPAKRLSNTNYTYTIPASELQTENATKDYEVSFYYSSDLGGWDEWWVYTYSTGNYYPKPYMLYRLTDAKGKTTIEWKFEGDSFSITIYNKNRFSKALFYNIKTGKLINYSD